MKEVQLLQVGERTEDEWADYIRAANIENVIIERGKRWLEFYEYCHKHQPKQGGSYFSEFAQTFRLQQNDRIPLDFHRSPCRRTV
jgi:hypothetical protein